MSTGHWDAPPLASKGAHNPPGHPPDTSNNAGVANNSAEGPVSRILSCAVIPLGAALPRTLISDLPGGFGTIWNRLDASGRYAAPHGSSRLLPSLFGLAPCGVYPAPGFTAGAVRSYRTFSPLPRRDWPFRRTWRVIPEAQPDLERGGGVAEAVSFLWHWPSVSLEAHSPDVIRHTALRSSDFPPPASAVNGSRQRPPGPPARV